MTLERWVRAYRSAWEHQPHQGAALALRLLATPSPFARIVTRDLSYQLSGGEQRLLLGPSALAPVRALDPLKRSVMVWEDLNWRCDAPDDAAHWDSVVSVRFGADERKDPALPDFPLRYYLPQVFGGLKPRLVVPRGEDLRISILSADGGARLDLSAVVRFEPEALMAAAGLVEPDTIAREGL